MSDRRTAMLAIIGATKSPSEELESETLEFKEYRDCDHLVGSDVVNEIVGFANRLGGIVVVGVRDSSKIRDSNWASQLVGFPKCDELAIRQRLLGKLDPHLDLQVWYEHYLEKDYLLIRVSPMRDGIAGTTSGKYYIRDGRSTRPMRPNEIIARVKTLQSFDWSDETIYEDWRPLVDQRTLQAAKRQYTISKSLPASLTDEQFLQSIGATKNGLLTNGGLLFLGKPVEIRSKLGTFEYQFTRRLDNGRLLENDIWSGNLWTAISRMRQHFNKCNEVRTLHFRGQPYTVTSLDDRAFHEAFINALVHRDYGQDGMVTVNFTQHRMTITSPGGFFGGVTAENITHHAPRHRNKALAALLLNYNLVDRAGMGVLRMSIRSLMYGRSFPRFREGPDGVTVELQAEYLRPGIFLLTRSVLDKSEEEQWGIAELLILNSLYGEGYSSVDDTLHFLSRFKSDPWDSLDEALRRLGGIVELVGTRKGLYIAVRQAAKPLLEAHRHLQRLPSSKKHVQLYQLLRRYGDVTVHDVQRHLNYNSASSARNFLNKAEYVVRVGGGSKSRWRLRQPEPGTGDEGVTSVDSD